MAVVAVLITPRSWKAKEHNSREHTAGCNSKRKKRNLHTIPMNNWGKISNQIKKIHQSINMIRINSIYDINSYFHWKIQFIRSMPIFTGKFYL